VRLWLTDRENLRGDPGSMAEEALWLSRGGGRLSVRSITKVVARVMLAAGVDETAHGLRHTVATRLVRDHGRDLALVADILGHVDVKTTRRCARSELEERRAALEALER
jgi:site-specific recombinase XerD